MFGREIQSYRHAEVLVVVTELDRRVVHDMRFGDRQRARMLQAPDSKTRTERSGCSW